MTLPGMAQKTSFKVYFKTFRVFWAISILKWTFIRWLLVILYDFFLICCSFCSYPKCIWPKVFEPWHHKVKCNVKGHEHLVKIEKLHITGSSWAWANSIQYDFVALMTFLVSMVTPFPVHWKEIFFHSLWIQILRGEVLLLFCL